MYLQVSTLNGDLSRVVITLKFKFYTQKKLNYGAESLTLISVFVVVLF